VKVDWFGNVCKGKGKQMVYYFEYKYGKIWYRRMDMSDGLGSMTICMSMTIGL
jgi:hypothetical protein